jgi:RNA polymerase sigma-32 factor
MGPDPLQSDSAEHLSRYSQAYPTLNAEAEQALCHRWRAHHDIDAAHQLVSSHMRLVVKLANCYHGYGIPLEDLIGEGYIGMMRAVCRFGPDRGIRFASYARWWIRAAIQNYIQDNWSLVKMGHDCSAESAVLQSVQRVSAAANV